MHRVWLIDELVRCILSHCSSTSISAMGRTCGGLFEIASDINWAKLPSLRPLAQLVRYSGGSSGTYVSSADKTIIIYRLMFYGSRVRSLTIDEADGAAAHMRCLLSLCDAIPLESIFSQLRKLDIQIDSVDCAEDAVQFALGSVLSLKISVVHNGYLGRRDTERMHIQRTPSTYSLSSFLDAALHLPRLDSLNLDGGDGCIEEARTFLHAISLAFPSMHDLNLGRIQPEPAILACLERMPGLKNLKMLLKESSHILASASLPHVVDLTLALEFRSHETCLKLLSCLNAPRLRGISAEYDQFRVSDDAKEFQQLSQSIADKWPLLETFRLTGGFLTRRPDPCTITGWKFTPFRPLLSCHLMSHMSVETSVRVTPTDIDIIDMSRAWPLLHSLSLGCIPANRSPRVVHVAGPPLVTLRGLAQLASCPQLHFARISIALSNVPPDSPPFRPTNSRLEGLDVFDSPSCKPQQCADYLRNVFPQLLFFDFAPRGYAWPLEPNLFDPTDEERLLSMTEVQRRLGAQQSWWHRASWTRWHEGPRARAL